MSSNTKITNESGSSLTTTIAFMIGSVVLAAVCYILVKYASFVIRVWRNRLHADLAAQAQAPAPTTGLRPSAIEAFPTFIYCGSTQNKRSGTDVNGKHNDHGNSNGQCNENKMVNGKGHGISVDCSICLCDLEENDVVRMLPECRHFYHIECIDLWLYSHPSCPTCRAKLQTDSEALTSCSMSPPLPQLCRYSNLQGSGQADTPATTEAVTIAPQIGQTTEIVSEQGTEMATSVDFIPKGSLCNDLSEIQIDVKDEVNIERCPIEYFGKSISSKEAISVYQTGCPSQKVPMDGSMSEPENHEMLKATAIKSSPEIQVEAEQADVLV